MHAHHADPSRTVVLLPYAQLMPVAAAAWANWQRQQGGACAVLSPRFETTRNWAAQWADVWGFDPGVAPLTGERAQDGLTALYLLEQAGVGGQLAPPPDAQPSSGPVRQGRSDALVERLLAATYSLAPLAAAAAPAQRPGWAAQARAALQALSSGAFSSPSAASSATGAPLLAPRGAARADPLALEAAVAQLAVTWAAASGYATDTLRDARLAQALDLLVLAQGFQPDPLVQALAAHWGAQAVVLPLVQAAHEQHEEHEEHGDEGLHSPPCNPSAQPFWHPCADAQDEALRAAACVLRHVQAGRVPVALAATDRVLTRRIRALLAACEAPVPPRTADAGVHAALAIPGGVADLADAFVISGGDQRLATNADNGPPGRPDAPQTLGIRDETGWKLSTTRAAASAVAALRACAPGATSDAVLDWLKQAPAFDAPAIDALEAWLRRDGLGQWQAVRAACQRHATRPQNLQNPQDLQGLQPSPNLQNDPESIAEPLGFICRSPVFDWQESMRRARPLGQWLRDWRALLQASGQWAALRADAAGQQVLQALHLLPLPVEMEQGDSADRGAHPAAAPAADAAGALFQGAAAALAPRPVSQQALLRWADEVLEAAHFMPPHPRSAQVVVLPLAQVPGRGFAALVAPGADEVRLPAAPEAAGDWTPAQRATLGLPNRATLQAVQQAVWRAALQVPHVDVLWRTHDDSGEALLPSPLVQALQLRGLGRPGRNPLAARAIAAQPVAQPAPSGAALPVQRLSASAYGDLRACPYRFFALRQLGLQVADELDQPIDKRDFGLWLHELLSGFHHQLQAQPEPQRGPRRALLDAAAQQAAARLGLQGPDFLPFEAAWPAVREGYLDWLAAHEAQGAAFEAAEQKRQSPLALAAGGGPSSVPGPVQLVGQIDRIDRLPGGAALVIDYKTESTQRTRERLAAGSEDTQLAFYALLMDAPAGSSAVNPTASSTANPTFSPMADPANPTVQSTANATAHAAPPAAFPAPAPQLGAASPALQAAYLNISERDGCKPFAPPDLAAQAQALRQGIVADLTRLAAGAPLPALGEGSDCDWCAARGLCRKDFWDSPAAGSGAGAAPIHAVAATPDVAAAITPAAAASNAKSAASNSDAAVAITPAAARPTAETAVTSADASAAITPAATVSSAKAAADTPDVAAAITPAAASPGPLPAPLPQEGRP